MKYKHTRKRILAGVLAIAMAVSIAVPSVLAAGVGQSAKTQWAGGKDLPLLTGSQMDNGYGARPNLISSSYFKGQKKFFRSGGTLPAKYDLRTQGLSTTIKDQSPYGSCWSFGALASAESSVLAKAGATGSAPVSTPDYAERHLVYYTYKGANHDAGDPTGNDYVTAQGPVGTNEDLLFDQGGNSSLAAMTLSRWYGAVNESDAPYGPNSSVAPGNQKGSAAHLQNAYFLASPAVIDESNAYSYDAEATKTMKEALMEYGVLNVSYYADVARVGDTETYQYYNAANNCQFTYDYLGTNHSVAIVGWDDDYPASNFNAGHQPEGNGAWIIKNSWGTDVQDNGYFYLSYYDRNIDGVTFFDMDAADANGEFAYDNMYMYDGASIATTILNAFFNEETRFSNVFTADSREKLEAISTYTLSAGAKVTGAVYVNPTATNDPNEPFNPENGTKAAEISTTLKYGGYNTITLSKPVELNAGDTFAVVLSVYDPVQKKYWVPAEYTIPSDLGFFFKANADISAGQSYIGGPQYYWADMSSANGQITGAGLTGGNATIRAFTTENPEVTETAPTLRSLGVRAIDVAGEQISNTLNTPNAAGVTTIELPELTGKIYFTFALNGEGKAEVLLGGVKQNDGIKRADFENQTVTVQTISPNATATNTYTFQFNVPDTVLTSNGVTLTDTSSQLKTGSLFAAALENSGFASYAAIQALVQGLGSEKFSIYSLSLTKGSVYNPNGNVSLAFTLPGGYAANKTSLYLFENGKLVKQTGLTFDTKKVNGVYVFVESQLTPDTPVLGAVTYSSTQTLADITLPTVTGGTWAWTDSSIVPTPAVTEYEAKFTPSAGSDYRGVTVNVPLTVNKANPVVSAAPTATAITYGQALSQSALSGGTVDIAGAFAWKDSASIVAVTNTGATAVFTPSDTALYNTVEVTVPVTVNKKAVTVTANNASKTYGDANPAFDFTVPAGALVGADTKADLAVALTTTASATSPVNTYAITGTASAANYAVTVNGGTLTVNKKAAVVAADNQTIQVGQPIPALTFTVPAGVLVGMDTKDDLGVSLSTTADASSGVGDYAITGTSSAANYTVTVTPGTLTISPNVITNTDGGAAPANTVILSGTFSDADNAKVVVTEVEETGEAYQAFLAELADEQELASVMDIAITGSTFTGKLKVTFPVDARYNGMQVTVLHFTDHGVDRMPATVTNGSVTVEVDSLSPFAVIVPLEVEQTTEPTTDPTTNPTDEPGTEGDTTTKPTEESTSATAPDTSESTTAGANISGGSDVDTGDGAGIIASIAAIAALGTGALILIKKNKDSKK